MIDLVQARDTLEHQGQRAAVDTAVTAVRDAVQRLTLRGLALDQRPADLTARRDALLGA
jgi:hypothetical protein